MDSRIYVGLANPLDTALDAHFYPQDFPPEWRLVFALGRFSCLYFSDQWLGSVDSEALEALLEELEGEPFVAFLSPDLPEEMRADLTDKLHLQKAQVVALQAHEVYALEDCLSPKQAADLLKVTLPNSPIRLVVLSQVGQCPAMIEQLRPLIELLGY